MDSTNSAPARRRRRPGELTVGMSELWKAIGATPIGVGSSPPGTVYAGVDRGDIT